MSMTNPYNNEANQGTTTNQMNLQKVPTQFNVYDPATGRNWTEDANGRRITPRRDMTGTQLVNINSRITQFNNIVTKYQQGEKKTLLPFLNDHNVRQMSIDSASYLIDELHFINNQLMMIEQGFKQYQEERFAQYEQQIEIITGELDKALKDPKVGAELLKLQQADRAKNQK